MKNKSIIEKLKKAKDVLTNYDLGKTILIKNTESTMQGINLDDVYNMIHNLLPEDYIKNNKSIEFNKIQRLKFGVKLQVNDEILKAHLLKKQECSLQLSKKKNIKFTIEPYQQLNECIAVVFKNIGISDENDIKKFIEPYGEFKLFKRKYSSAGLYIGDIIVYFLSITSALLEEKYIDCGDTNAIIVFCSDYKVCTKCSVPGHLAKDCPLDTNNCKAISEKHKIYAAKASNIVLSAKNLSNEKKTIKPPELKKKTHCHLFQLDMCSKSEKDCGFLHQKTAEAKLKAEVYKEKNPKFFERYQLTPEQKKRIEENKQKFKKKKNEKLKAFQDAHRIDVEKIPEKFRSIFTKNINQKEKILEMRKNPFVENSLQLMNNSIFESINTDEEIEKKNYQKKNQQNNKNQLKSNVGNNPKEPIDLTKKNQENTEETNAENIEKNQENTEKTNVQDIGKSQETNQQNNSQNVSKDLSCFKSSSLISDEERDLINKLCKSTDSGIDSNGLDQMDRRNIRECEEEERQREKKAAELAQDEDDTEDLSETNQQKSEEEIEYEENNEAKFFEHKGTKRNVSKTLIEKFKKHSEKIHQKKKETLALIFETPNKLKKCDRKQFLFFPQQTATKHSVEITDLGWIQLGEFMNRPDNIDLRFVGWIHDHAGFESFLSSVDLHNIVSMINYYKLDLSFYSIVTDKNYKWNLFEMDKEAVDFIAQCQGRDFHNHEYQGELYFKNSNVELTKARSVVLDKREEEVETQDL